MIHRVILAFRDDDHLTNLLLLYTTTAFGRVFLWVALSIVDWTCMTRLYMATMIDCTLCVV